MKKFVSLITIIGLLIVSLTACGEKPEDNSDSASTPGVEENVTPDDSLPNEEITDNNSDTSIAVKLADYIKTELDKCSEIDEEVVGNIARNQDIIPLMLASYYVADEYIYCIEGGKTETEAISFCISPYISTIPFVCYIFETEDTDALAEELKAKAMPNWNICTMADITYVDVHNNYVIFIMSPSSFED